MTNAETLDRLEDEIDELTSAELEAVKLTEASPAVLRLYASLRDLEARGTSNNLEVGRVVCRLLEEGENNAQIAVRSRDLGIVNCASIGQVSRLSAFATLIGAALEEFDADWVIPSEGTVRPLCKATDPLGVEWKLDKRLGYLADAVKIAADEQAPLRRPHITIALERDYPKPPRPASLPVSPRVRKVTTQLERIARELGADAVMRAAQAFIAKHEREAAEAAAAEGAEGATAAAEAPEHF